ncbi:MAG TPA: hypothetical protein VGW40_02540 [Allosphingosinicella sp.]|nr:hypothetical protein [Allosphingosinicella sp.]
MKKLTIAALLGAQLLTAAQPAMAAELAAAGEQRVGAFGGLRVRLPLGGNPRENRIRAGLTLAPTLSSRAQDGESRLRFGEGLELGLRGREPIRLSIGGRDLRRLGARDENDRGIPTGAWIAGGLVLVTIAGVVFIAVALENADDSD